MNKYVIISFETNGVSALENYKFVANANSMNEAVEKLVGIQRDYGYPSEELEKLKAELQNTLPRTHEYTDEGDVKFILVECA